MDDSTVNKLCATFFIVIVVTLYYFVDPIKQGFWCDDRSIRYEYRDLIISLRTILISTLCLPCFTIKFFGSNVLLRKYFFGYLVNLFVTIFTKFATGRLRPHFIAVCRPNIDCENASFANVYITNYTCENSNYWDVKQARQSFFSGHASIAFYSVCFLTLFIQQRFNKNTNLLKPTIQVLLLFFGLIPGLTQILNHWHHWSDVAF
ncbi:lipid phosphate phosphohydrolase 3-like protein, partial [Dinothrombium tinctorium]